MKTILLAIILAVATAMAASSATVTREDIKKTVEHMRRLAQEQAAELTDAQRSNTLLKESLAGISTELKSAKGSMAELQGRIDRLNEYATKQENRASKAEDAIVSLKDALEKKNARISWLSIVISCQVAVIAALGALKLNVPQLSPPYGMVATFAGPAALGLVAFLLMRFT